MAPTWPPTYSDATIFRGNPKALTYYPTGVTAEEAAFLQGIAWATVQEWQSSRRPLMSGCRHETASMPGFHIASLIASRIPYTLLQAHTDR